MLQSRLQLFPAPRVRGGFEIGQNALSRQFKALPFTLDLDLLRRQRYLSRRCSPRRRFLHLRLDGLAFPAAGHTRIVPYLQAKLFLVTCLY
jgi:hypothetical protein